MLSGFLPVGQLKLMNVFKWWQPGHVKIDNLISSELSVEWHFGIIQVVPFYNPEANEGCAPGFRNFPIF